MKQFFAVIVLAALVAVPITFARDDAPAEGNKTAKNAKSAEHKGGKEGKAKTNKQAQSKQKSM